MILMPNFYVTISTHNGGGKAHRAHNIRSEKVVSREAHIDPNGTHEEWIDIPPREAYEQLFGKALKAYNEKKEAQHRHTEKIDDYYNHIQKNKKKHAVYEMIIGIYDDKEFMLDPQMKRDIMKDFVDGWEERNPNLKMIGAYYHADEKGGPHVHIDYIPWADGYKNGLETQNGLVKALGKQGFVKEGKATAQIKWEQRENQVLDEICQSYGLTVLHPQKDNGKAHIETEAYKLNKELEETKKLLEKTQIEYENYKKLNEVILNDSTQKDVFKVFPIIPVTKEKYNHMKNQAKDNIALQEECEELRKTVNIQQLEQVEEKYSSPIKKQNTLDDIIANAADQEIIMLKNECLEQIEKDRKMIERLRKESPTKQKEAYKEYLKKTKGYIETYDTKEYKQLQDRDNNKKKSIHVKIDYER